MTSNPTCVCCGQPMADSAYACVRCGITKPAEQLRQLSDMVLAARDVAHGLSRRGGGGASGKPGSRSPANDDALDVLHEVTDALRSRIRLIEEERGLQIVSAASGRRGVPDPLAEAATALCGQLEWLRHVLWVDEALTEIGDCVRKVRWIVDGPAPKRYLGPCGAVLAETAEPCPGDCSCRSGPRTALSDACTACSCFTSCHPAVETEAEGEVCTGDIYAREGASAGRCRSCGAQVSTDARRAWLDAEVRSRAFRAAEIAAAYGINVKTIRSWATERQARYDHSGTQTQAPRPAKLHPHVWDRDGRPLFLIGEVLDLAAADAARREEARADRARRMEQRSGGKAA